MLTILKSRFASSAREAFCHKIEKDLRDGVRSYLIVPEQQTVLAEGYMAKTLPPEAVLTFEVTNFTRLANTTFRSIGGLSGEYCDSTKKALIMWRTLTELSPILKMTSGRREINSGLVESCLSAVSQMQNLSINPQMLSDASEHEEIKNDGRLASRLSDLAAVFSLYKKLLGERYSDTGDDAEAMINKLLEKPDFLKDTNIYIEGFTSFTEPQYTLVALLAARTNVYVSLSLPKGREKAFEYTEIQKCKERLVSVARKHEANVKLDEIDSCPQNRKASLDEIAAHLWSTDLPNDNITLQNSDDLRVFQAHTPYDECAFVCEDIKRRVIGGALYSDIAIVARGAEDYQGILDGALSEAKIPAFTSYRRDINEFEAIKLIYTAYAIARGFKREDVISFAKCSLSGIGREECDEFEMYVNKWQISGRRFTDDEIWNMNPDGYSTKRREGTDEKLLRIHNVRSRIVEPLADFADKLGSASTVREHALALLDFLVKIDMEESLRLRAKKLSELGENTLAEGNAALWKVICNALDTLVTVLGDMPADAEGFVSQLKVVFSATDIGRIPAFSDQVMVGSADMLRLYEKKHIYLIGVNAGKFPATVSDKSYFSESDRIKLKNCGIEITPDIETRGARELYFFTRAFSYATDSVTLSYSAADTRFKAIEPAEIIGRLSLLTGDKVKPIKISSLPIAKRVFSPESALSRIGEFGEDYDVLRDALEDAGYARELSVMEGDISNGEVRLTEKIVESDKPLWLSQTVIDSYVKCPFGYFCKYVINLQKDQRAEFDSGNIGLFIHAILENFFAELSSKKRSTDSLTEEEKVSLTRSAAEKYIAKLGDDVINASFRTRIKIDRLCRAALPVVEGLCEEFAQSAFQPRFFELSIGEDREAPDPIHINATGGEIIIKGVIDRVDAYKKDQDVYIRVIDYKTGKKTFEPSDMAEGSNLQMFLYLKALVESEKKAFHKAVELGEEGRLVPAGVIYVKTDIRDVKIDRPDDESALDAVKDAQQREGMILNNNEIIDAMTLRYTPVYSKKSPTKIANADKKYLYTEEQWDKIMDTVEDSVKKVADQIRCGDVSVSPKEKKRESPCDYCEFKPVCRKA